MRTTFLLAFMLVGCGGNDFVALFGDRPDSDLTPDMSMGGAAGAPSDAGEADSGLGGTGSAGTGGGTHVGSVRAGGAPSASGGTNPGSGGAPAASGGAVMSSGGTTTTTGGTGGACNVVHSNGLGQTWIDCAPLGTYDQHEATRACIAYTGNPKLCYYEPGCGTAQYLVQGTNGAYNILWGYDGNTAGFVGLDGACPNNQNGLPWR